MEHHIIIHYVLSTVRQPPAQPGRGNMPTSIMDCNIATSSIRISDATSLLKINSPRISIMARLGPRGYLCSNCTVTRQPANELHGGLAAGPRPTRTGTFTSHVQHLLRAVEQTRRLCDPHFRERFRLHFVRLVHRVSVAKRLHPSA